MKSLRTCFAGLIVLLLLVGCAQALGQPAGTPQETLAAPTVAESTVTPPINPTPLPPPTRRPTALESPSLTPATTIPPVASYTLVPTSKFTRTATPTITRTSTRYVRPPIGGLTWTPANLSYACNAFSISPAWGAVFKPRTDFLAVWKLVNTGTNMWHVDDVVFGFVRGERMQNPDFQEKTLPYTIYVGDKIYLQTHMIPPKEPGTYNAVFGLRKTNKKDFFCLFDVLITVAK
ncbi:MAG: NBR1-Ig-like domain-containing protein [Anaerolineales bacterium]